MVCMAKFLLDKNNNNNNNQIKQKNKKKIIQMLSSVEIKTTYRVPSMLCRLLRFNLKYVIYIQFT